MTGSWLLFPALLLLLALGCGLLLERLARVEIPGALLIPAGFATLIVAGQLTTSTDATAELTVPLVAALAVAGFALGAGRRSLRPNPWAAGAAALVFAVYGAPVLLSGEATFAGYIRLDDTATWLALTDRVMEHGPSLAGLAPSTYEATLAFNLGDGYPVGVFIPLGAGHVLTGIDSAWLIQPYISLLAAMLALSAWQLLGRLLPSAPLRAGVAALGAQPALLVGYAQWGGIKEVAAAALVALCVALTPGVVKGDPPAGRIAVLAVAIAALMAVLSLGGLIWVLPALALAAWIVARGRGPRLAVRRAGTLALGVALFSLPLLVPAILNGRILPPTSSSLASDVARGNLISPLGLDRLFGIWPAGDFRLPAADPAVTTVLIVLVALLALAGLWGAVRSERLGLALYGGGALVSCVLLVAVGSPWVDGKAMATASPAILLLACAGAGALIVRGRRVEGGLALALIAAGVVWSNALAYRDANLAPRDQLAELERIGEDIAGQGPALLTEYQPYGARHFLREANAEAVSELRRREVPLRSGEVVTKGNWVDTDDLGLEGLGVYRTLVLRRSPEQSRPPSPYELRSAGEYYEVWQRPVDVSVGATVREHLPLGGDLAPGATASCAEVRRLARTAGTLAYAAAAPVVVAPGLTGSVELPQAGTWRVWDRGSIRGEATVTIDGTRIGSVRHLLNNAGLWAELGSAELEAGTHAIELGLDGASFLHPGSGGEGVNPGPIALTLDDPRRGGRVRRSDPSRVGELCGERLDWVESLAPQPPNRTGSSSSP